MVRSIRIICNQDNQDNQDKSYITAYVSKSMINKLPTESELRRKKIVPETSNGRYLSSSEMEQFKMDCPVCGFTVNLLEFSGHLKEDVAEIRAKYKHAD